MTIDIFNKSLLLKYPISIYIVSSVYFKSIDESNIEWYSEKPIEVIKEIRIKDAIAYAKRKGVKIRINIPN